MRVADFDFDLPADLIAQFPPAVRGGSRLLHVETSGTLHDRWFSELPTLLRPDDLLVMNDTRKIKARLFGQKVSGGKVELLVERVVGEFEALAFIRASHAPKPGSHIQLSEDTALDVLARQDDLTQLRFPRPVLEVLDSSGGCRCRPTSTIRRLRTTRRATRPCTPTSRVRWPRRRPDCISTTRCWIRSSNKASARRGSVFFFLLLLLL